MGKGGGEEPEELSEYTQLIFTWVDGVFSRVQIRSVYLLSTSRIWTNCINREFKIS